MFDNRRTKFAIYAFVLIVICGCAATIAPDEWLPAPEELQHDSYGGWILLTVGEGSNKRVVEGEFISVEESMVYVLPIDEAVRSLPLDSIRFARLQIHRKQHGRTAGWTVVGTLSTLSHGFYLLLTAPSWLLVGILSSASVSKEGDFSTDNPTRAWWVEVAKFSRFPQGLPEGLDTALLRGKKPPEDLKP
ncbi:MAG TPA: hypothetical protein VNN76_08880 [Bacteroidota bacterium]|nr:hypothetical protein [Bacteroidota bacterium]